ncbi:MULTISPECIES: methionyl-tRNA formyltransferase [Pseudoalteromonas]|uniref:Methionyl-tRNA formyltransferase n=1 Tax=Pseudoalteromonas luteoviolacea (strain 2ta16) TaxID=1353533 RepID=V4HWC6_PSEL2|nr:MULTISPECIES: formyltransferase family protein [Pseudoalteromonas]ESP95125.1 methionyl-tRNA formyltransferase [Pseudoalteromonas luteoviolacea 2ta16]KZN42299.1 hypothetical protein N483_12310 [Pseudoalteromonas luteoviolacea NCIMB 1944]MCG7547205.1 hypothetical protein [Pseudoalteromonas sp. Of7M-16]
MFRLCVQGQKGLESLKGFHSVLGNEGIIVSIGKDANVVNDFSSEIQTYCESNEIKTFDKSMGLEAISYTVAVGWQRIINDVPMDSIIVMHDSILPRYRGFNPLVSALLNGDEQVGVTAIIAEETYDTGPIVAQEIADVSYPIKISNAIELVSGLYKSLSVKVANAIADGKLTTSVQDESKATYSLWRDNEDYFIDFSLSAEQIQRHVNSVGAPYMGAQAYLNDEHVFIDEVEVVEDVHIENRAIGKVIFLKDQIATIVCGKGLIKILSMRDSQGQAIRVNKFRSRFK